MSERPPYLTPEQWDELQRVVAEQAEWTAAQSNGHAPDIVEGSSWEEIELGPLLTGERLDESPTIMPRADGSCLFYEGKMHAIQAEPESGKGWLGLAICLDVLAREDKPHVAWIDFEDSPETVAARLVDMGADEDDVRERFHYFRPDEPLSDAAWEKMEPLIAGCAVAIMDGVNDALAIHGLSLKDNDDVIKWLTILPRRIKRLGVAVVMLDHVTKSKDERGRWAIGAQAKLAGIDVAYTLDVIDPLGVGRTGLVKLTVAKDRPGYVRQFAEHGKVAAFMKVTSDEDGDVMVTFDLPTEGAGASFRPTGYMERVSKVLEDADEPLNMTAIKTLVGGKAKVVVQAVELLVSEDFVKRSTGARGEKLHEVETAFRELNDG